MNEILFSQEKHIGLITLNRSSALNALTLPMIHSLQEQLTRWDHDASVHAIVIQATPGKAFCAGGDVRWLYERGKVNDPEVMSFFWHEYRLNYFISRLSKPYIALMDGVTMGGGVGISLHGSHPVATERFVFAMPETGIGFFPDIGASYLLTRCPGKLGIYLGLTGERLNAPEAKRAGLVCANIKSNQLESLLTALIHSDLSSDAFLRANDCIAAFTEENIDNQILPYDLIDSYFSHHTVETIMSEMEKSHAPWQKKTLETLSQKAPLSLKVTLAQLQKASTLDRAHCLQMDYCLVTHFMQDKDFFEGVRALLVDKDKTPHWHPASFQQITDQQVNQYFESERALLLP